MERTISPTEAATLCTVRMNDLGSTVLLVTCMEKAFEGVNVRAHQYVAFWCHPLIRHDARLPRVIPLSAPCSLLSALCHVSSVFFPLCCVLYSMNYVPCAMFYVSCSTMYALCFLFSCTELCRVNIHISTTMSYLRSGIKGSDSTLMEKIRMNIQRHRVDV